MKKSMGLMIALGIALVGCGGGAQYVVLNDGAVAREALASEDFVASKCPVERNSLNAIQGRGTPPNQRSESVAMFEGSGPPQRSRTGEEELWGTKYPLKVAVDRGPIDIAVIDDGDAKVRMTYVSWASQQSMDAGFQRVQLNPCEEDSSRAYRFWPGGFMADREDVCVKVAIRDGSGEVTVEQVSLGEGCPDGVD